MINCVLEIEKGPIHPPSWSIDPFSCVRGRQDQPMVSQPQQEEPDSSDALYFAYMKEKEGEERDCTVSSSCYIEKEEK